MIRTATPDPMRWHIFEDRIPLATADVYWLEESEELGTPGLWVLSHLGSPPRYYGDALTAIVDAFIWLEAVTRLAEAAPSDFFISAGSLNRGGAAARESYVGIFGRIARAATGPQPRGSLQ